MKVNSDLDKINKIVTIFSIIKNGNLGYSHIRPRCVEVVSYYVLFGYNKETRSMITATGLSKENLHQINAELTKLGYLIKDSKNYHNKFISPELQKIRDYFLDDKIKDKMLMVSVIE